AARADRRAQSVHPVRHRRTPAGKPGQAGGADSVRDAEGGRAADVRALHQRGDGVSLLLRAISGEPDSRVIRIRRHADPSAGPAAGEVMASRLPGFKRLPWSLEALEP